ncbi:STAND family AAA ATPase [Pseudacidovorax intermedius]|uniref:STAND family AAA ATPase n=1 Tax=Pseudacidovorax intermedius TaxID=433924 RepID=UPI0009E7BE33|nr:metallophosphoesterase [Pseudacidovorax intermedius]
MNQRILLLHLSDIHISSSSDLILAKSSKIAAAIFPRLPEISTLAILITGDVAYSGTSAQYALAIEFIESIKSVIFRENSTLKVEIFVCPGNHDCDFSLHDDTRDAVIAKIRNLDGSDPSNSLIKTSTCVQDAFFSFRDQISPHKWLHADRLTWQTVLSIGGRSIGFRCLNVAWMSELREKQGTLVFPPSAIQPFDSEVDLSITLLHHPFNWLAQSTYRPFLAAVRRESHVIFSGHEHFQNAVENNDLKNSISVSIDGGVLFEKGSPDQSTFNTVLIDLETQHYLTELFSWDGKRYSSQVDDGEWGSLRPLPTKSRAIYELEPEFSRSLNDPGANFSHSAKKDLEIDDVFVWPELRLLDDPAPIKKQVTGAFLEDIENLNGGVFLRGDEKVGKSTLLRQFFKSYYSRGFLPLYFRASWFTKIHRTEPLKALKYALDRQYKRSGRDAWLQESKELRVLFIDDIDGCTLSPEGLGECLTGLFKYFSGFIVTARDGAAAMDILALERVEALSGFQQYEILEFGHKKRFELVCKWAEIGGESEDSATWSQTIDKWEKDLTTAVGRQFVPAVPIYLLTLLQSIESGRTADLQNSAFGHYYQFLVTSALQNVGIERQQWSEVINYCANLAWFVHSLDRKNISEREFEGFNKVFSDEFTPVASGQRKRHLMQASILASVEGQLEFKYPYLYYYFLGQYLADRIHEAEIQQVIIGLCEDLYLRENANILLFTSHHTKSPVVYEQIAAALEKCFSEEPVFDFNRDSELLNQLVDSAPSLIYEEDSTRRTRASVRESQDRVEEVTAESENGIAEIPSAITRLFRGMEILGQFLKNHYGTTKNPVKDELIEKLLRSALRGLYGATVMIREDAVSLASYIERLLAEGRPDLSAYELKINAKRIVFDVIGIITFAFIQKASTTVGSTYLKDNLSSVVAKNQTLGYELIEMSYQLDLPEPIPFARLKALNKSVEKNIFCQALLSSMALRHLHLFKVSYKDKQRLCDELGITLQRQLALDHDRRSRRH